MKKHLPYDCNDNRELFDDSFHAASMSDCTGLIPTEPTSQNEIHSYSEIYDIPLPNFRSDRREFMNNQNNNQSRNQKNNQSKSQRDNQSMNQRNRDNNDSTNQNNQDSNQSNQDSNQRNHNNNDSQDNSYNN